MANEIYAFGNTYLTASREKLNELKKELMELEEIDPTMKEIIERWSADHKKEMEAKEAKTKEN